ncbi:MAG: CoA pyrophosphatase [Flavipsychrobacter sp.]|nr:CoA pyrophosphatase [Flavipsychrobacter sp.]
MDRQGLIGWIKQRLLEPLPGVAAQELMAARVLPMPLKVPSNARESAVLCLLFHKNGLPHVLLIKRMADKGAHSGQVSFPGGRRDPEDPGLQETALREMYEETGIDAAAIQILGALTPLYIPVSNFMVYPFVGYTNQPPQYNLSQAEVDYVMEIPLKDLFAAERKTTVDVTSPAIPDVIRQVKAYLLQDGTIIWGATAMILSELEVVTKDIIS